MSPIIVLDSSPLGAMSHPEPEGVNRDCYDWFKRLLVGQRRVIVPEIADYEIRRELIRAGKARGIRRLNEILAVAEYLPITTEAMRKAAELWAQARNRGAPTADPHARWRCDSRRSGIDAGRTGCNRRNDERRPLDPVRFRS